MLPKDKQTINSFHEFAQKITAFGKARNWQQFYTPKDMSLALIAEVGELVEHFKWHTGDETKKYLKKHRRQIAEELADVLYWIILMSHQFDIDLGKAFVSKMGKNERKYPIKQFKGKHPNPA